MAKKNRIIFRDLKPENLAFDYRGDLRLFDFGLAKELKEKDLIEEPDMYNCTGQTGSRRYMAPEVVQCMNYGFSVDIYSFAVLFWEVFSDQSSFEKMDNKKHFEQVVLKRKRPNVKKMNISGKTSILQSLIEKAWSHTPTDRPSIQAICNTLSMEASKTTNSSDRSNLLAAKSVKSLLG